MKLLLGITILILFQFSLFSKTKNDLKDWGFSISSDYLSENKKKSVRKVYVYPSEEENAKSAEANKIYGKDFIIEDANAVKEKKEQIIMYYPGVIMTNMNGLTGLIETYTANTLKKGEYTLGARFTYNKISKTNGNTIEFKDNESADMTETPVTASMGITDNLEVGLLMPIQSWKIRTTELEPMDGEESGFGDISLKVKYRVPLETKRNLGFALGMGLKFPSGNEDTLFVTGATGEPTLEFFSALSQQYGLINTHLNAGYIFTGDPSKTTEIPYAPNADVSYFNMGMDYSKVENISMMLEINVKKGNGTSVDFTPGIRAQLDNKIVADLALPISLKNTEYYGRKFKLVMGALYKF